jgi:transposase-like protein
MNKQRGGMSLAAKLEIVKKSKMPNCVIKELARLHNISKSTIYLWQKTLAHTNIAEDEAIQTNFCELKVHEKEINVDLPKPLNLRNALLDFGDFVIEGKINSLTLGQVIKILESLSC